MDRFLQAILDSLPSCRPDVPDARLVVQVIVERDGSPQNRHCGLVFGDSDLLGRWWGRFPAAQIGLQVSEDGLHAVRAGIATGTSLVMSDRVRLQGEDADLVTLRRYARSPRFRSYMARLAAIAGPSSPGDDAIAPSETPREAVVVLAAPNDAGGVLSPMARDRTRAALELVRSSSAARLVLTGGFGSQFNTTGQPHWSHCAAWLADQGVPPGIVLACLETRHSYEDVLFMSELFRRHRFTGITVVTSDYHAARIRFILDLVLPGVEVVGVRHDGLPAEQAAALRRHELCALAMTISSALVFGPDRLLAPLTRTWSGPHEVWRPARRTVDT
jgi:uncharacterized SAM-binding protein YcdF (DUF218 family)